MGHRLHAASGDSNILQSNNKCTEFLGFFCEGKSQVSNRLLPFLD